MAYHKSTPLKKPLTDANVTSKTILPAQRWNKETIIKLKKAQSQTFKIWPVRIRDRCSVIQNQKDINAEFPQFRWTYSERNNQ